MIFGVALAVFLRLLLLAYIFRRQVLVSLETPITIAFHYLTYRGRSVWASTRWMGRPLLKWPCDLWIYQEIIHDSKPDLIIETGTNQGGSALYYAHLLDLLGHGQVVSVDIAHPGGGLPAHPRIEFLKGSSTAPEILAILSQKVRQAGRVMVILDSDHSQAHVARELELYSKFVTDQCYLVVEDTNVNGHPVWRSHGPGPMEAVLDFLKKNPAFIADRSKEKYNMTLNPHGWLRRADTR
jgi:cephalosporin hydroxylase